MIKRMKKLSGALVSVLLLAVATAANAHEAADLERSDCSVTVVMKYDGRAVAGGSLTLYRVGGITEDDAGLSFKMDTELNCDADMGNVQSEKAAKEVCGCVKRQNLSGVTADINEDGIAAFRGLATGLYLIRQKTAADGFNLIKPFLISVPLWDGGHYIYNITAASKTGLHRIVTPKDQPDQTLGPRLPQTGQLNWPVPALLALGAALLVTGFIMRKKNGA